MGKTQRDTLDRFSQSEIPIKQVIELYNLGESDGSIARQLGIKQQTVSYRLRKLGYEPHFKKLQPMVEKDGLWFCERCATYKQKTDFIYNSEGGLRFRFCRRCKHQGSTASIHKTYVSFIRNNIRHLKYRVRDSGIPFDIDTEFCVELWEKQNGKCFYTDTELVISNTNRTRHGHSSASLDRIVPELGYIRGNVVWCVQRINVMKNNATLDEMKKWMPDWYRRINTTRYIYQFVS